MQCAYKICGIYVLRSSLKTLPYTSPTNDRVTQLGTNLIDTGSIMCPFTLMAFKVLTTDKGHPPNNITLHKFPVHMSLLSMWSELYCM